MWLIQPQPFPFPLPSPRSAAKAPGTVPQRPASILLKYFLQGLLEEGTVSTTLAYLPTPVRL